MAILVEKAFAKLDRIDGQLPIAAMMEWFADCPLSEKDLSGYLIFSPDRYVRNRLHDGPCYQALLLCWRNGQRSPIHNHRGSSCGVKVLRGLATETIFQPGPNGMFFPILSRDHAVGHVCVSADADTHQISNLQAGGADLVTLHVYSPPLFRMDVYSLDSPQVLAWDDPINDPFPVGGGI